MMMPFYRLVYALLKTLAIVLKPFLGEKAKKWINMRSAFQMKYRMNNWQNPIWIHASSGEIEYAKSLIRELKQKLPASSVIVTYSSESAEKLFENIRSFVDHFIPLPWDDRYSMSQFIRVVKPQILVISRTDIWPEMVHQCSRYDVPIGLISYFPTFTFFSRLWLRPLLTRMNFISCVDTSIQQQLQSVLSAAKTEVRVDGDTRFDQVFARIEQPTKINIQTQQKIFAFGSTWPEDESRLQNIFETILKNNDRIILGPHDISDAHLQTIEEWLTSKKYTFRFLSEFNSTINFDFQILVIDQIGFLADVYRYSHFAFVGGSFKARVHSVMEPLACGVPVLVGPHYQNSPEALRFCHQPKFVFVCYNAEDLKDRYQDLRSRNLNEMKTQIQSEMQKNKGASAQLADFILRSFLKK